MDFFNEETPGLKHRGHILAVILVEFNQFLSFAFNFNPYRWRPKIRPLFFNRKNIPIVQLPLSLIS